MQQELAAAGDLGQALAEVGQHLTRRPVVDGLSACRQDEDLVGSVNMVLIVGDHHHGAPRVPRARAVRQGGQQIHNVAVQLGVQARGRLIQEKKARTGEQLNGGGHTLALAAGELLDALVHMLGQVEILQDLGNASPALLLGHILGEAQLGGVFQCLAYG